MKRSGRCLGRGQPGPVRVKVQVFKGQLGVGDVLTSRGWRERLARWESRAHRHEGASQGSREGEMRLWATQPRFQARQGAWHQAGHSWDQLRAGSGSASAVELQVRPAHAAHLDDSVSLADPAVFGCNAVGIHLQGTYIHLGDSAPPLRCPSSRKGQPRRRGPPEQIKTSLFTPLLQLRPAASKLQEAGTEQRNWD